MAVPVYHVPELDAPKHCSAPQCSATEGLKACSGCGVSRYCSRDHQRADWSAFHKHLCVQLRAARLAAEAEEAAQAAAGRHTPGARRAKQRYEKAKAKQPAGAGSNSKHPTQAAAAAAETAAGADSIAAYAAEAAASAATAAAAAAAAAAATIATDATSKTASSTTTSAAAGSGDDRKSPVTLVLLPGGPVQTRYRGSSSDPSWTLGAETKVSAEEYREMLTGSVRCELPSTFLRPLHLLQLRPPEKQTYGKADRDNVGACMLMANLASGYAPERWQTDVGPVLVLGDPSAPDVSCAEIDAVYSYINDDLMDYWGTGTIKSVHLSPYAFQRFVWRRIQHFPDWEKIVPPIPRSVRKTPPEADASHVDTHEAMEYAIKNGMHMVKILQEF